jgi:hypothetical protein
MAITQGGNHKSRAQSIAAAYTLAEAQAELDSWKLILAKKSHTSSYSISDRSKTSHSPDEIAEQIALWSEVIRIKNNSTQCRARGVTFA